MTGTPLAVPAASVPAAPRLVNRALKIRGWMGLWLLGGTIYPLLFIGSLVGWVADCVRTIGGDGYWPARWEALTLMLPLVPGALAGGLFVTSLVRRWPTAKRYVHLWVAYLAVEMWVWLSMNDVRQAARVLLYALVVALYFNRSARARAFFAALPRTRSASTPAPPAETA